METAGEKNNEQTQKKQGTQGIITTILGNVSEDFGECQQF